MIAAASFSVNQMPQNIRNSIPGSSSLKASKVVETTGVVTDSRGGSLVARERERISFKSAATNTSAVLAKR